MLRNKIIKDIKKDGIEYMLLAVTSIFFLILLSFFQGERTKQFVIVVLFVIYYIVWGLLHHQKDQTLTIRSLLEYILFGIIAVLILRNILIN